MKSIFSFLFLFSAILSCFGQDICSGSLGENIFERGDFGSGTVAVLPNDPNIAPGYNYTTNVPPDGWYTICNNTGALNGLYPTWLAIRDNSGDPNGYMMVVNASFSPGVFYEELVVGLCENTLYEFSADIINLIKIGTTNHLDPNVSFLIDGVEVYSTGNIPKTEQWRQYGFSFVTTSVQTSITLTLRNNAPGGIGNDLALDNISFRPCGPSSFIGIESDTTIFLCIDDDPLTIIADIEAAEGQEFAIQWQESEDGINWSTIEDSTNNTLIHSNFIPGDYYYRYFSAANENNILNEKCRIISDKIKITILPDTYEVSDTLCEGLTYDFGNQSLTVSGDYIENFESRFGCDSTVFLDLFFIPEKEFVYEDIVLVDPSCFGFGDGSIQVNALSGGNGDLIFSILEGSEEISGESLSSGQYIISVTDRFQCSDFLNVSLIDPPEVSVFIGNDTMIRLGDELRLSPNYSEDFPSILWSGQGDFNCLDCEEPIMIPFFDGDIAVVVMDENGCEATHSIAVTIDDENFIALPNIFSPNDDNINDEFTIHYYGRSVSLIASFSVYDRWGGLVHRLENQQISSGGSIWDGYKTSSKVAQGVYLYELNVLLINGDIISRTGDVTVLK
ncbi:MAG: gliding motility-associated C-terminal domain-containing protein [Bacteroidota bacterium]